MTPYGTVCVLCVKAFRKRLGTVLTTAFDGEHFDSVYTILMETLCEILHRMDTNQCMCYTASGLYTEW